MEDQREQGHNTGKHFPGSILGQERVLHSASSPVEKVDKEISQYKEGRMQDTSQKKGACSEKQSYGKQKIPPGPPAVWENMQQKLWRENAGKSSQTKT